MPEATLTLEPPSGPPGTVGSLIGVGFATSLRPFDLQIKGEYPAVVFVPAGFPSVPVWSTPFAVARNAPPGTHEIVVTDASGVVARTAFTVTDTGPPPTATSAPQDVHAVFLDLFAASYLTILTAYFPEEMRLRTFIPDLESELTELSPFQVVFVVANSDATIVVDGVTHELIRNTPIAIPLGGGLDVVLLNNPVPPPLPLVLEIEPSVAQPGEIGEMRVSGGRFTTPQVAAPEGSRGPPISVGPSIFGSSDIHVFAVPRNAVAGDYVFTLTNSNRRRFDPILTLEATLSVVAGDPPPVSATEPLFAGDLLAPLMERDLLINASAFTESDRLTYAPALGSDDFLIRPFDVIYVNVREDVTVIADGVEYQIENRVTAAIPLGANLEFSVLE